MWIHPAAGLPLALALRGILPTWWIFRLSGMRWEISRDWRAVGKAFVGVRTFLLTNGLGAASNGVPALLVGPLAGPAALGYVDGRLPRGIGNPSQESRTGRDEEKADKMKITPVALSSNG